MGLGGGLGGVGSGAGSGHGRGGVEVMAIVLHARNAKLCKWFRACAGRQELYPHPNPSILGCGVMDLSGDDGYPRAEILEDHSMSALPPPRTMADVALDLGSGPINLVEMV